VPPFWTSGPAALAPPAADKSPSAGRIIVPVATSAGRDPSDERAADFVGVIAPYQGTMRQGNLACPLWILAENQRYSQQTIRFHSLEYALLSVYLSSIRRDVSLVSSGLMFITEEKSNE
jgi:hypothetical protein